MNPHDILQPNYLGVSHENRGLDDLQNKGWGVEEAKPEEERQENGMDRKVRRSAARQFGLEMDNVFNDESSSATGTSLDDVRRQWRGGFSRESYNR